MPVQIHFFLYVSCHRLKCTKKKNTAQIRRTLFSEMLKSVCIIREISVRQCQNFSATAFDRRCPNVRIDHRWAYELSSLMQLMRVAIIHRRKKSFSTGLKRQERRRRFRDHVIRSVMQIRWRSRIPRCFYFIPTPYHVARALFLSGCPSIRACALHSHRIALVDR